MSELKKRKISGKRKQRQMQKFLKGVCQDKKKRTVQTTLKRASKGDTCAQCSGLAKGRDSVGNTILICKVHKKQVSLRTAGGKKRDVLAPVKCSSFCLMDINKAQL